MAKQKFIPRPKESAKVIRKRWTKKRDSIENLANNVQKLRYNVSLGLKDESNNEKNFLTCLVIAIMSKTFERVGNETSKSERDNVGITGLRKNQVTVIGNKIILEYKGKSGVEHEKMFSDEKIAKAIKKAKKNSPDDDIFTTSQGFKIKADRVNRFLSDFDILSKNLRGFGANNLIIKKLNEIEPEENEVKRKRQFNKVARFVAKKVGHGLATLKKHYLIPELEPNFIDNSKIIEIDDVKKFNDGGDIKVEKTKKIEVEKSEPKKVVSVKPVIKKAEVKPATKKVVHKRIAVRNPHVKKEAEKTKNKVESSVVKISCEDVKSSKVAVKKIIPKNINNLLKEKDKTINKDTSDIKMKEGGDVAKYGKTIIPIGSIIYVNSFRSNSMFEVIGFDGEKKDVGNYYKAYELKSDMRSVKGKELRILFPFPEYKTRNKYHVSLPEKGKSLISQSAIDSEKRRNSQSEVVVKWEGDKPAYLMTKEEYKKEVTPKIKEYYKFLDNNKGLFSKFDFQGIIYLDWNRYKEDYDKRIGDSQYQNASSTFKRGRYGYNRDNDDDIKQASPELVKKLDEYIKYFTSVFGEKNLGLVNYDENNSSKRSIRRAIDDGTYSDLLREGKVNYSFLKSIFDSVGVNMPSKLEKVESEVVDKGITSEVKADLVKREEDFFKNLKSVFKHEIIYYGESYERHFSGSIERMENFLKSSKNKQFDNKEAFIKSYCSFYNFKREPINEYGRIVGYTQHFDIERVEGLKKIFYIKSKEYGITEYEVSSDWKKILKQDGLDYANNLFENFGKRILSETEFINGLANSIPVIELGVVQELTEKGFNSFLDLVYPNGFVLSIETHVIYAGGFNIQKLHIRALFKFQNQGTYLTSKELIHVYKNFNTETDKSKQVRLAKKLAEGDIKTVESVEKKEEKNRDRIWRAQFKEANDAEKSLEKQEEKKVSSESSVEDLKVRLNILNKMIVKNNTKREANTDTINYELNVRIRIIEKMIAKISGDVKMEEGGDIYSHTYYKSYPKEYVEAIIELINSSVPSVEEIEIEANNGNYKQAKLLCDTLYNKLTELSPLENGAYGKEHHNAIDKIRQAIGSLSYVLHEGGVFVKNYTKGEDGKYIFLDKPIERSWTEYMDTVKSRMNEYTGKNLFEVKMKKGGLVVHGIDIPDYVDLLLKEYYAISKEGDYYDNKLKQFIGELGLVPDEVRNSDEYKELKHKSQLSFNKLQDFNKSEKNKSIQDFTRKLDRVSQQKIRLHYSDLKKDGGSLNPYAVCTTSIGKTEGTTKRSDWSKLGMDKFESCVLEVKSKMSKGGELSVKNKVVYEGDKLLRDMTLEEADKYIGFYHEKKGNIMFAKNSFVGWFYDIANFGEKINSGEFDFLVFPPVMRYDFNGDGIVDKIWKTQWQKAYKGAKNLLGMVQGWYDEENKNIVIQYMSVRPSAKRNRVNSFMIQAVKKEFDATEVIFDEPTKEGKIFSEAKTFNEGGDLKNDFKIKVVYGNLLAPNGKPSNLNPEQYKLVRTPEFKSWFGRWDVLAKAKLHKGKIIGIYKKIFDTDVEQALFEVSMQVTLVGKETIIETFGNEIYELAIDLFPNAKLGDVYEPKISKVVDENGEPKVLFHGSNDIDKINIFKSSKGFDYNFLSTDFSEALRYTPNGNDRSKVKSFFINVIKTLDCQNLNEKEVNDIKKMLNIVSVRDAFFKHIKDIGFNTIDSYKEELGYEGLSDDDFLFKVFIQGGDNWIMIEHPIIQDYIKSNGYDSFTTLEGDGNIAVYNPTKIKLADGSNTKFDSSNPDIRFDNGGEFELYDEHYEEPDYLEETMVGHIMDNLRSFKIQLPENERFILSHDKEIILKERIQETDLGMKPDGLWYAFGTEWVETVVSVVPQRAGNYKYIHKINITDKVLSIKGVDAAIAFTEKYGDYNKSSYFKARSIDWTKVAQDYSGIEVKDPYQLCRPDLHHYINEKTEDKEVYEKLNWLLSWDASSGCIWKKDGIESIEVVLDWEKLKIKRAEEQAELDVMYNSKEYLEHQAILDKEFEESKLNKKDDIQELKDGGELPSQYIKITKHNDYIGAIKLNPNNSERVDNISDLVYLAIKAGYNIVPIDVEEYKILISKKIDYAKLEKYQLDMSLVMQSEDNRKF